MAKNDITFTVLKPLKSVKWTEEADMSESKGQGSGSRRAICAAKVFQISWNFVGVYRFDEGYYRALA
jgi:hypothetical protein